MSTRRRVLHTLGTGLAASVLTLRATASSGAPPRWLPRPASLADDLGRALAARKALVLLVSLDGCPYCKLVRESYLLPLRTAGQPVIQTELAAAIPLLDLRGRESTHAQVARELGVRLAPTVLFLGRGGAETAPRLEGVASPDFYGAYLHERVEAANRSAAAA